MSRDYTLRLIQSNADRVREARKKGKQTVGQPKGMKLLRPKKHYKGESA